MRTSRLDTAFAALRARNEKALVSFVTAGDPLPDATEDVVVALAEAGADVVELGIPFSDPLADGATHHRVYARALASGATLDTALDLARVIRRRSPETPVALMSYYNPLRQRGDARLAAELAEAGSDAALVPDLPHPPKTLLPHTRDAPGNVDVRACEPGAPQAAAPLPGAYPQVELDAKIFGGFDADIEPSERRRHPRRPWHTEKHLNQRRAVGLAARR